MTGARASGLAAQLWAVGLIVLLSGALQRPLGGDGLEGSMLTRIVESENRAILRLGAAVLAMTLALSLIGFRRLRLPPGCGWALALNGLALASVLWSPLPETTLKRAAGLSGASLIALHLYSFWTWEDFARALYRAMAGLVLATALLALLRPDFAFHQASGFYGEHAGLLRGSYVHKNALARMLALALVVLVCLRRAGEEARWPDRWAGRALILLTLGLIGLTGAAKTALTLPAAFALTALVLAPRRAGWRVLVAAALLYGAGLVALSGLGDWLAAALLDLLGRDTSLSGRTLIWQAAAAYTLAQDQTLLGGGYAATWQAGMGDFVQARITFNPGHPHNGYISVFTQTGAVGLALALAHLWRCAARSLCAPPGTGPARRFAMTWLVLFAATNAAGSHFIQPMDLYWTLIVLTPAIPFWQQRQAGRNSGRHAAGARRAAAPCPPPLRPAASPVTPASA